MEYEYNGVSYYIDKISGESDNTFFNRCWFIIKQEPKTLGEFNYLVKKSEIWSNYKFLGCTYDKEIQDDLENINKNIIYTK